MQDNYHSDFDPKFVDQAWSEMHKMLDQEMPVNKPVKKRGLIWWSLGTLLLGLIAGITYFSWDSHQTRKVIAINSATNQEAMALADQNTNSQNYTTSSKKGFNTKTETQETIINLSQPKPSISSSHSTIKEETSSASVSSRNTNALSPIESSALSTDNVLTEANTNTTAATAINNNLLSVDNDQLKASMNIPFAATLLKEVSEKDREETIHHQAIVPHAQHSKFTMGIEGGIYSFGFKKIDGLQAALFANVSVNPRIYLRSGLGFAILRPAILENSTTLSFNNTALNPSQAEGKPSSYITARTAVTDLSYAYIYCGIGYNLTDKLALEGSIIPALLSNSTLQESWTYTTQDAENNSPFVSRISVNPKEVSKYLLSYSTGLRYQFNSSFDIRLHYQANLSDLLTNTSKRENLRGINLSMAYRIR